MACHHHHHHQHHHTSATCCSTCSCSQCFQPAPASSPFPQQSDHLLQALASLLQPQQNHYLNQTHLLKSFQDQNFATKNHHFHQKHQEQPDFLISSLVSRINALESSLHSFSKASSCSSYPSFSLKDAAARVIQTHFRAFLVHRSRTLRQLKDLAFIKSSLNTLKLSVSNNIHFDPQVVSQKAMDLLLKLDSFQGGDPMIRDGKRSVSKDLIQFLEYVDGLVLKRHKLLYKNAKNIRVLRNGSSKPKVLRSKSGEVMEKLRDRVEKLERFSTIEEGNDVVELEGFHQGIDEAENQNKNKNKNGELLLKRQGIQPKVKKTVSFAENGNVYRIISNGDEVSSSGDGSLTDESVSSDERGDTMENLVKESEDLVENLEEAMNLNKQARSNSVEDYQIQGGDFVFSAPLPVKMESKADLMKKRNGALKIVSS
ncbi:BAG family molecular chaperone regulator 8, chloroplastic [Gossypium australe]|uniref:BAG family molecular chaperone regulator 8, chloroplastic n=1 Tax=Gossypium australe TaxID=47621 RepID=A0A5B6UDC7_9ROSI|nr:BAG family molecular chaperone regulator 8, chloroplastic [Gossypium australe]